MILLDLLVAATGGALWQRGRGEQFGAFASDSREVALDDLFVAVRGVHADGHDFALAALAAGAGGVLVEAERLAADGALAAGLRAAGGMVVAVPEVRLALRQYAAAVLRAWHPRVIAVAGSAGKTTTKEAIATVLSQYGRTFRSWRNYNDLLGLPLALGRLEPDHEFAVLEMSCDYPGEIAALAEIAPPEIAVILNTHATHLDGLGSREGLVEALAALPRSMHAGQTIVLNGADALLREMMDGIGDTGAINRAPTAMDGPQVVWFGNECADALVRGSFHFQTTNDAVHGHMNLPDAAEQLHSIDFPQLWGGHWADAILASLTVAKLLDIEPVVAATQLQDFTPLPGRLRLLNGVHGIKLLDDSHNAIPAAVKAALRSIGYFLENVFRIAVLGDMRHLGQEEVAAHQELGQFVVDEADWLVTQGSLGEIIAQSTLVAGMRPERVIVTHTAEDAANAVLSIAARYEIPPLVLIKGSPEMRMEAVTERLLADPSQAGEVLDRQRSIWQREIVGELHRPTWLEIDLGAIGGNARAVAELVGPTTRVMATLKADAYGHGALKVARTVLRNGATWLGVATVSEAVPLRQAGIDAPILVYGYVPPWQARDVVRHGLRATVYASETAQALARAASALGQIVRVHVKIDSGMGRLGLRTEDVAGIVAFVRTLHTLPGIEVEGIYTHFAAADEADLTHARMQLQRFEGVLAALAAAGLRPPVVHAANSAATLLLPEARYDLVRPGIILYGLAPSEEVALPASFRPALTFKTQIAQVKVIPAGESISYGRTYTTMAEERVAVLPVGYADGFRRGPANWGAVLIHGQRAPIRGRVCMDQTIVSVQHIPQARAGDEVVLIGSQGSDRISAEEVAARLGTSNYEVVSALLARVPRVNG